MSPVPHQHAKPKLFLEMPHCQMRSHSCQAAPGSFTLETQHSTKHHLLPPTSGDLKSVFPNTRVWTFSGHQDVRVSGCDSTLCVKLSHYFHVYLCSRRHLLPQTSQIGSEPFQLCSTICSETGSPIQSCWALQPPRAVYFLCSLSESPRTGRPPTASGISSSLLPAVGPRTSFMTVVAPFLPPPKDRLLADGPV